MPESRSPLSLKDVKDLPTLPAVAAQAMAVAQDPGSTASDLLRVIMTDPPLAAKVLRVANSVYFTRAHDVSDLQTAIVRLGFTNVRNLLMGVGVIRSFNAFFVGAPYTREDFWVHSISVGVLASRLSAPHAELSSSTAFVTGLLHDLGKLVLDRYLRDSFLHAIRLAQSEGLPLFEAERRRFGGDHAQVAGDLLELWKFPRELSQPVKWHHEPDRCDSVHRPHAMLLEAADYFVSLHRIGYAGNDHPGTLSPGHLERLKLTEESVLPLLSDLENDPLLTALLPI